MRKNSIILGLSFLLTSCLSSVPNKFQHFTVVNYSDTSEYELCEGGITAKYTLPEGSEEISLIPPDSKFNKRTEINPIVGQEAVIEAWCYGKDQSEVGYVKVIGKVQTLSNLASQAIIVSNPFAKTSTFSKECLLPTEQRAKPLCVFSKLITVSN